MKKILVTGARSKLVKPVIKYLLKNNLEVNLLTKNEFKDAFQSKVNYYQLDLQKEVELDINPDTIIHAAGYVPYNFNKTIPDLEIFNKNISCLINILNFSLKKGVKKIIFLSSTDVYGFQNDKNLSEGDNCDPDNIYGLSKLGCERIIETYNYLYNIDYTILRIGPVFGKGMNKDLTIYKILKKIHKEEIVEIYNPDSILSLLPISDVSKAIISACNSPTCKVNVAGLPITLNEFLLKSYSAFNQKSKINIIQSSKESVRLRFNTSQAKTLLNWKPSEDYSEAFQELFT